MSLIERPIPPRTPHTPPTNPKPPLSMIQLPIYRVKARALEDYFYVIYRIADFDFMAAVGVMPGECPEYDVRPYLPPAITSARRADDIRGGRSTRDVGLILTTLCIDGYIPAGKYLVDTSAPPSAIDVYTSLMKARRDPLDPECLAIKKARRNDKLFLAQAKVVDQAVEDWLKEQSV